jgi:flagellar hook-length control protein FliK
VPVPIAGLAVQIVTRAQEGLKSFEIRLDPPELGRVDVRLDVDRGGHVTTRLTVDRVETLDILRRDSANLERALQQAGLKTDGGLEFSLRDQSLAHRDQSQPEQQNGTHSRLIVTEDEVAASEAARRGYGRLLGLGTGLDIRV